MTCQACVLQQKGAVGAKHPTEIGDTHLLRPSAILLVGRHCVTGMKVRMGEMVNKPTFALAAKACWAWCRRWNARIRKRSLLRRARPQLCQHDVGGRHARGVCSYACARACVWGGGWRGSLGSLLLARFSLRRKMYSAKTHTVKATHPASWKADSPITYTKPKVLLVLAVLSAGLVGLSVRSLSLLHLPSIRLRPRSG